MKQGVSTPVVVAVIVVVIAVIAYFGYKAMAPNPANTYHSNMAEQMGAAMQKAHAGGAKGGPVPIPAEAH